jgi:RNA polymerase-interacting CarD/CdnL/TRCF family regulator
LLARPLTPNDRKWLSRALERLSTEAALVDGIDPEEANAAIRQVMDQVQLGATV